MEDTANRAIDGFSPEEIYVLCGALEVEALFGLEEKKIVNINAKGNAQQQIDSLKEKGVLNTEERLTKRGALLIRALETYSKSNEYGKLNNLSIALTKQEGEDNVVILFEDEKDVSYRIEVWPRKRIISLLMARYDFFRRRAAKEDYEYLTREIESEALERIKKIDLIGKPTINFQWFKRPAEGDAKIGYEHKLFFTEEDQIIQLDVVEQTYAGVSLFYLYKQIFDWLNIPYGTEALINGQPKNRV